MQTRNMSGVFIQILMTRTLDQQFEGLEDNTNASSPKYGRRVKNMQRGEKYIIEKSRSCDISLFQH